MVLCTVPCSIWFSGACRHWSWWVPWLCCRRRCWLGCTVSDGQEKLQSYISADIWTFCSLWFGTKPKLPTDSLWCASSSANTTPPLNMPNWTKRDPRRTAHNHICRMLKLLCNAGFPRSRVRIICKREADGVLTCSLTSMLCSASRMRVTACMICFPWELMIWSMCWQHESQERRVSRRESVCVLDLRFMENLCKSSTYQGRMRSCLQSRWESTERSRSATFLWHAIKAPMGRLTEHVYHISTSEDSHHVWNMTSKLVSTQGSSQVNVEFTVH